MYIYKLLGKNQDSQLDAYEFFGLCDILLMYFNNSDMLNVPRYGRTLVFPRLQPIVNDRQVTVHDFFFFFYVPANRVIRWFEYGVLAAILTNGIIQTADTVSTMGNTGKSQIWSWSAIIDAIFLLAFEVELLLRIFAFGFSNYISANWHRY